VTFDVNYALELLPLLLRATLLTIEATVGGMALALVGGLVLTVLRLGFPGPISRLATAYIEFVRSTPLLIQLFFLFYVLPRYGVAFDPLLTGIVALGLHYSAYTAEVYRAGILSVPPGQWEAATALNFSTRRTWTRIILPQALPPVIPALGNYVVSMFKDTPLLATITVSELLGTALNEAGQTYRYFEPLTIVGLIFLGLSYPSALLIRRLELRYARR
jgi:polar amino acid transport system permease protein